MSPDPNPVKTSIGETKEKDDCGNLQSSSNEFVISTTTTSLNTIDKNDGQKETVENINKPAKAIGSSTTEGIDVLKKPQALSVGRERRNVASPSININETFIDPQSPSSSSSTSQATSANDATFEPTIEMMVNDFDDEQTLNEEEALAALESQDPDEEINTLKEESEMPLEELLAKYSAFPPHPHPATTSFSEPLRKKSKKKKQKSKVRTTETNNDENVSTNDIVISTSVPLKNIKTKSGDEKDFPDDKKMDVYDEEAASSSTLSPLKPQTSADEEKKDEVVDNVNIRQGSEIHKVRRSHLLDLYPEGTFDNVVVVNDTVAGNSKDISLETLYGVEDDDDEEDEEIEEDEDYKKKVMIGTSYQATIPVGLSQYGDILPYENEDKLIWEPSQVSEREVEEYLLKIRDIKSNLQQGENEEDDDNASGGNILENNTKENGRKENNIDNLENNSLLANGNKLQMDITTNVEIDINQAVVKDNEQALHLLVQCGYDFKEALRRKRLNALPLNDCMSLWSEEECHKFEEGIQKYGKDFLKIRQNQVRTRTMRELVQFYYLWKKSERRDHNFANADTVDHMDIYLNEDNEYGSNPASVSTPVGSPVGSNSNCTSTRRNSNSSQKNISIMTTTSTSNVTPTTASNLPTNSEKNSSNTSVQQHPQQHQQQQYNKRRTQSSCSSNNTTANELNHENSLNSITKFSK